MSTPATQKFPKRDQNHDAFLRAYLSFLCFKSTLVRHIGFTLQIFSYFCTKENMKAMNYSELLFRLNTLFLSLLLYSQAQASCLGSREKREFNGDVKSIDEYAVKEGDTILVSIATYDKAQNLIKESINDGTVWLYKYDSRNNETERMRITIEERYNGIFETNTLTMSSYYLYDKDGHVIVKTSTTNDSLVSKEFFKYNEKGELSKYTHYHYNDSIACQQTRQDGKKTKKSELCSSYTIKWKDRKQGNQTEILEYENGNTLFRKEIGRYDVQGRLLSEEIFEKKPEEHKSSYAYSYDEAGNLIELTSYENDSLFLKTCYTYNSKHYPTEEKIFDKDGTLVSKRNWKYDRRNNIIETFDFQANENKQERVTYDYDEEDNVTKEEVFIGESDSASCTTLYYYEYYDE